jgi:hypothetical protein
LGGLASYAIFFPCVVKRWVWLGYAEKALIYLRPRYRTVHPFRTTEA